jgi:hypothetical protein
MRLYYYTKVCNNDVKISPLQISNFHIITWYCLPYINLTTLILKLQFSFTANSYTVLTDVPILYFRNFNNV